MAHPCYQRTYDANEVPDLIAKLTIRLKVSTLGLLRLVSRAVNTFTTADLPLADERPGGHLRLGRCRLKGVTEEAVTGVGVLTNHGLILPGHDYEM